MEGSDAKKVKFDGIEKRVRSNSFDRRSEFRSIIGSEPFANARIALGGFFRFNGGFGMEVGGLQSTSPKRLSKTSSAEIPTTDPAFTSSIRRFASVIHSD